MLADVTVAKLYLFATNSNLLTFVLFFSNCFPLSINKMSLTLLGCTFQPGREDSEQWSGQCSCYSHLYHLQIKWRDFLLWSRTWYWTETHRFSLDATSCSTSSCDSLSHRGNMRFQGCTFPSVTLPTLYIITAIMQRLQLMSLKFCRHQPLVEKICFIAGHFVFKRTLVHNILPTWKALEDSITRALIDKCLVFLRHTA